MPTYVIELRYDQDENYRLAVRPAHREHLTRLSSEGALRLAGPMADGEGGMMVVDAPDRDALDAVLARDPYFSGDQQAASVRSVREWQVLDLPTPGR